MSERAKRVSSMGPRAQAMCDLACDGFARVIGLAKKVSDDIDQITSPGVPIEISEEDSMVTELEAMVDLHKAVGVGG
jgi:hypothetical protein